MLWDLIRDFFVTHIFGGSTASGAMFNCFIGVDQLNGYYYDSNNIYYNIGTGDDGSVFITFGDYFSTIATIISIVAIVLLCCLFIKKIYNMCAHIIG